MPVTPMPDPNAMTPMPLGVYSLEIIDDPQEIIPVPLALRHRCTEVIFIAMEQEASEPVPTTSKPTLTSLAGCWEGDLLERAPQI